MKTAEHPENDILERTQAVTVRIKMLADGLLRISEDMARLNTDYGNQLRLLRESLDEAVKAREGY